MASATDAPAKQLITALAEKLKTEEKIKPPSWAKFVKTGPHVERQPSQPDWWYTRCASILRKAYLTETIGVGRLRTWYGGRKNRGSKPEKHTDASGNIIRKAIQQLEAAGYLKKTPKGRVITPKGQSLLQKTATVVKKIPKPEVKRHARSRGKTTEISRAPAPAVGSGAAGTAGAAEGESAKKTPKSKGKRETDRAKAG